MEYAQYVNEVGQLINDSTKTRIKLDRLSITNLVLYNHLNELYDKTLEDEEITDDMRKKLKALIQCLKAQINFYPEKLIDEDCILTETEDHIIQE